MCYARCWVQGYLFDRRYLGSAKLAGRIAVVTGGTEGGLGYAGAEILARMGASVVLTVRSDAKGKAAVARLKRAAGHDRACYEIVDFRSEASVRSGAAAVLRPL